VTLDQLGQRYGMLPSQILHTANTFDLEVLDIARSWEKLKQNKANGIMPDVKQEVLLDVIKQVRGNDS